MNMCRDRRRSLRWERYIKRTTRSSMHHHDFLFGLSVKITPGYFAPRRIMRRRGSAFIFTKHMTEDLFR